MAFLWEWGGVEFPIKAVYPEEFEPLQAAGMAVAGSPETVRKYVERTVAETGITYFVCDMAFGSIPFDDASRSVDLFAREVMPHFR
jgi:hypothetical protein